MSLTVIHQDADSCGIIFGERTNSLRELLEEVSVRGRLWATGILLISALALATCGREKAKFHSPASVLSANEPPLPRVVGNASDSSPPVLHRSPTWQDVSHLTPFVDYIPNEILVLFNKVDEDELPSDTDLYEFNRNSVLYQDESQAKFARALAKKYSLELIPSCEAHVPGLSFAGYRVPSSRTAEEVMQEILDNEGNVRLVEYRPIRKYEYVPNDPDIDLQWHHEMLKNFEAWDKVRGDGKVWVAVIDSGVNFNHPDLKDDLLNVNQLWPDEDFDLGEPDKAPLDTLGHGSHVSGIVSATGDNSLGVAGGAFGVKILPIKIGNDAGDILGDSSTAVVLATELGAKVINMSFGYYSVSRVEREAIRYAYDRGVIITASAGNDSNTAQIHFPSGIPEVISVGAVDIQERKTPYSNFGLSVDIAAPGGTGEWAQDPNSIYSTLMEGYGYKLGTSMSAPMVAATAALIISKYGNDYTPSYYRGLLEDSGIALDPSAWQNPYIRLLDSNNALTLMEGLEPTASIVFPEDNSLVDGLVQVQIDYSGDSPLMNALLYVDGVLQPSMEVDFTDYFPGEHELTVEVIDENHRRAFPRVNVIVPSPRVFPAPYRSSFDTQAELEGWVSQSFSGDAIWHTRLNPGRGYALALGRTENPTPYFTSKDVDWLISPSIDLRNSQKALLRFYADWYFDDGMAVYLKVIGDEKTMLKQLSPSTFSGYYELDISEFAGGIVKVAIEVPGGSSGPWNTLRIDDFALAVPTPPPDVTITQPYPSFPVRGVIDIKATATDPTDKVEFVEFYLNGEFLARDESPPYSVESINTDEYPNGNIILEVRAYDNDFFDDDHDGSLLDFGSDTATLINQNYIVTGLSPTSGFYGDEITITGEDFSDHNPNAKLRVSFNGANKIIFTNEDEVLDWQENVIRVKIPALARSGAPWVHIDDAGVASPVSLSIPDPFASFKILTPAPNITLYGEDLVVELPAQAELEKVEIGVLEVPTVKFVLFTMGKNQMITQRIPTSAFNNGTYTLFARGFYRDYAETLTRRFFVSVLDGDFDGDGTVGSADMDFLRAYLLEHGAPIPFGSDAYLPYLDPSGDGRIDEQDVAFVGYHFGISR